MSLFDKSDAYYKHNDVYERFSECEDSCHLVYAYLHSKTRDKHVLDAGCGTGKYLKLLAPNTNIHGVDLSKKQLDLAYSKHNRISCQDLANLAFADKTFDIAYSPWVLGTIGNLTHRQKALNELKRVAKHVILIENSTHSEFEYIRMRNLDNRTKEYNDWILNNGFKLDTTFHTSFEFDTILEAKEIFEKIWNKDVASNVNSAIIKHHIDIYTNEGE